MTTEEAVAQIKERLPVDQVVGRYVPLKRAGRTLKGLCPFHGEKTPSFTVNVERGIYKCFGCGRGGDIFAFVMEHEGLTFPEALRLLADQAGVQLPEQLGSAGGSGKRRILEINDRLAAFWHRYLLHEKGRDALDYLIHRGLTQETLANFSIGYAPFGDTTASTLTKAGYSRRDIEEAGDPTKFRDRIVFPICDVTGRTVGFTGRILERKDDPTRPGTRGPKYWNTPETAAFVKSKTVFALHMAKRAIQDADYAILAEGQMDVVLLHQGGFPQAVASSGTALTAEQLRLIGRFSRTIAIAYDGDGAGQDATEKAIALCLEEDLAPLVVPLPAGKDPADLITKDPASWKSAWEQRQPAFAWLMDRHAVSVDDPAKKRRAAEVLIGWLARYQSQTEVDGWFAPLAARLKTAEENVRSAYARVSKREAPTGRVEQLSPQTANQTTLANLIVALLTVSPEALPAVQANLKALPSAPGWLGEHREGFLHAKGTADTYLETLGEEARTALSLQAEELLHATYPEQELTPGWVVTELHLLVQRLRAQTTEQTKASLAAAIAGAQAAGDHSKVQELLKQLTRQL